MFQPFSPTEKQCDKKVRNTGLQNSSSSEHEEQHLLQTFGASSSSLNNPTGSARVSVISNKNNEKKKTEGFQQQHSAAEGCKHHSRDRHNSASSGKNISEWSRTTWTTWNLIISYESFSRSLNRIKHQTRVQQRVFGNWEEKVIVLSAWGNEECLNGAKAVCRLGDQCDHRHVPVHGSKSQREQ